VICSIYIRVDVVVVFVGSGVVDGMMVGFAVGYMKIKFIQPTVEVFKCIHIGFGVVVVVMVDVVLFVVLR